MNKTQICQYFKENHIVYELMEHRAIYNMEELDCLKLPYPDCEAKNLFVRDDKKENYCLITVKGNKRVNLKEFRKRYGLRSLSFASADDLMKYMNLTPGSVSPLGILNDADHRIHFYLDAEFSESRIAVHPNDNTATLWMQADDLVSLIRKHGNQVEMIKI